MSGERRRPRHSVAAIVLLVSWACEHSLAPILPANAIAFQPPPQYSFWWSATEACAGVNRDYSAVQWYIVPDVDQFSFAGDSAVFGLYYSEGNRIVMAARDTNDGSSVRHEMLHAILQESGHPLSYFRDKCGGIVYCDVNECPPPPAPPDSAAVVDPSALGVVVSVLPDTVSIARSAGWAIVSVSATNASSEPVWVNCSIPQLPEYCYTFGYSLGASAPGYNVPATGADQSVTLAPRVGFAAGEKKQMSFDIYLGAGGPKWFALWGWFDTSYSGRDSLLTVP